MRVGADDLDEVVMDDTIGSLLKYREDQERVRARGFGDLLATVRQG